MTVKYCWELQAEQNKSRHTQSYNFPATSCSSNSTKSPCDYYGDGRIVTHTKHPLSTAGSGLPDIQSQWALVWHGSQDTDQNISCEVLSPFLCFADRPSWYNLRQWPTWYTHALFYNTFITIVYMFRALYSHHQEVELYWCSIWYRHCQSVAVRCTGWERTLPNCASDSHWLTVTTPDAASVQLNLLMMSI